MTTGSTTNNPIVELDFTYKPNTDWCQMIITRINQISKLIHESVLEGGANELLMTPRVLEIFKPLHYVKFEDGEYTLSGRYKFKIDENAEPNSVLVIQNKINVFGKINILDYE